MRRVEITRPFVGICHMQVCASKDATDEEILAACNTENTSGTRNGWAKVYRAPDAKWMETSVAPVACSDDPTRLHLLVGC